MQRRRKSIIGLACLMSAMLLFSSCGKEAEEEKQDTQTQADTEKEEPKEKEGQGNLNIISPQAYSNVDGLTLEPGTYISLIGKEAGTEYWKVVEKGAKQAVSELNSALGYKGEDKIKLNYSGPSESESVDEQINILDEELARYPNAVGIAIIDSNACSVQFDLATENGIPIVAFDSGSDYQGLQSLCATNNTEAAQTAAVNLATALDNKGKVLVFVHDSKSTTARERQSGFADTLAKDYPEVEIAEVVYLDNLEDVKGLLAEKKNQEAKINPEDEKAAQKEDFTDEQAIQYILEQHPDVTGCFTTNVDATQKILSIVNEMKQSKDTKQAEAAKNLKIIGFDGGEKQMEALENGELEGLVVQNPYGMGYATVIACARSIANQGNEAVVDTGYVWVTKDNMEDKNISRILY